MFSTTSSTPKVRFGILGASWIAPTALIQPARTEVSNVTVVCIAARDVARAREYAAKHSIPVVHESYADVISDPNIDAVYIGLPNSHHMEWTIKALEAGKHVLCEKPISNNAEEAQKMADAAEKSGKLLMEAFHYRYHPLIQYVKQCIVDNAMGTPVAQVHVKFCIPIFLSSDIRYNYSLGGGAMMDTGCYTANCVRYLVGEELKVLSATPKKLAKDDRVDQDMNAQLQSVSGSVNASIDTSLWSLIPRIYIDILYNSVTVTSVSGVTTSRSFPKDRTTYGYMVAAFAEAVLSNNPASILTTAEDGVKTMQLIDEIYRKAGMQPRGTL